MGEVSRATALQVAVALGWPEDVVGPVSFGGVRFWGAVRADPAADGGPGSGLLLEGALVVGPARASTLAEASMLAPYAPRAVLVPDSAAMLDLLVRAAMLDQGLVVLRGDGDLEVLSRPGPRTAPSRRSAREVALLGCLGEARQGAAPGPGAVGAVEPLSGRSQVIGTVPTG